MTYSNYYKSLPDITIFEINYLSSIFKKHNGFPSLENLWELMDTAWKECLCDPNVMDERVVRFYRHPVWLLNTLFIEQHSDSINHRTRFTDWAAGLQPKRIADIGGGGGTLSLMLGERLKESQIEIIEPYPNLALKNRINRASNVRYVNELSGKYDLMIATDVFEHVYDPIVTLNESLEHLEIGGNYLIANCFLPVICCHLPRNFHFRHSWDVVCSNMGLHLKEHVLYGSCYYFNGEVNLTKARKTESKSIFLFPFIERFPRKLLKYFIKLL